MSEYTKIQKDHFSNEKSQKITIDEKDLNDYIDKVEKQYHKNRKEMWWDAYKQNYLNRHKDQVKLRGSKLE